MKPLLMRDILEMVAITFLYYKNEDFFDTVPVDLHRSSLQTGTNQMEAKKDNVFGISLTPPPQFSSFSTRNPIFENMVYCVFMFVIVVATASLLLFSFFFHTEAVFYL